MIDFIYNTEFEGINEIAYKFWIEKCIEKFNLETGELTYTFVNDDELLEINKESLNHDFYTDIITFDQRIGDIVSGDIFISIDRVKENAENLNTGFDNELKRVVIHGLLHIIGFDDKTEELKQEMRKQEDECINNFTETISK